MATICDVCSAKITKFQGTGRFYENGISRINFEFCETCFQHVLEHVQSLKAMKATLDLVNK